MPYISGVETGLSSDPEMNWRLSQLDSLAIISNSDAHSPSKIGRECNAFQGPLTWQGLREILLMRDKQRFYFTVEFFPEEGKYHWPGHRDCNMVASPKKYRELKGICPVCKKSLTGGVASRVEVLADRPEGYVPAHAIPSVHLVPLEEIISEAIGKGVVSQAVKKFWDNLVLTVGSELDILLSTPSKIIEEFSSPEIAQAIIRMRKGEVIMQPGYDGVYGRVKIFDLLPTKKKSKKNQQLSLI